MNDSVHEWSGHQRATSVESYDRLRLATALSAASNLDEVAEVVGRWAPPVAGATFANLAIFDPPTNRVRVVHGYSLDSDLAEKWAEFPIDARTPLCAAILTGQPVLLGDLNAIGEEYDLLLDDTVAAGLEATASLPLKGADGSSIGAIGLAWPRPQSFDASQLSELGVVTELVARAARRVAKAAGPTAAPAVGATSAVDTSAADSGAPPASPSLRAVHDLQEALLARSFNPTRPLDVAAAYLPASDAPMGGDWYDVFPVEDATCLVIGDVAGHGIDATAAMAELKHAVRAYAVEDASPAAVVSRTNRLIHRLHPGLTATLIVSTWQHHSRTLWRCNAGHPPMLSCRPGEFEFVPLLGGPDLLLGVNPDYEYRQEARQLRPDTTILLYSDGLVEQPPEPIDDTMERLLDFCREQPSLVPQRLVNDILLWRLRQGSAPDDICLMAVRLP